jgi:hypothetical protein
VKCIICHAKIPKKYKLCEKCQQEANDLAIERDIMFYQAVNIMLYAERIDKLVGVPHVSHPGN